MMKVRYAAVSLMLIAAACTQSRISPSADVSVEGSVSLQDGSPSSGTRVVLSREADFGEVLLTGVFAGLPCLELQAPPICSGAKVERTGSDGRFSFDLEGRETQGTFGTASTLVLSTRLDRAEEEFEGAATTTRFQFQATKLDIPLRLWQPKVAFSGDFRIARAIWDELPSQLLPKQANPGAVRTSVRFERAIGETVWVSTDARSGADLDARLLEDTAGTLAVYALIDEVKVEASEGTDLEILLRSARVAFAGGAGKPASRAKGCFVYNTKGEPVSQSPCRITDGNFAGHLEPSAEPPCPAASPCPEAQHKSVFIDLGAPVGITLVVVRGCPGRCTVETSLDGSRWRVMAAGQAAGGDVAVAAPRPTRASHVRISSDGSIAGLREVSVWPPPAPPSEPPPLPPVAETSVERAVPGEGGRADSTLIAIALALILGTWAGLSVRRSRRWVA